jgi:hypothetical protein
MEVAMSDNPTPRLVRVGRVSSATKSDVIVVPLEAGSQFLGRAG